MNPWSIFDTAFYLNWLKFFSNQWKFTILKLSSIVAPSILRVDYKYNCWFLFLSASTINISLLSNRSWDILCTFVYSNHSLHTYQKLDDKCHILSSYMTGSVFKHLKLISYIRRNNVISSKLFFKLITKQKEHHKDEIETEFKIMVKIAVKMDFQNLKKCTLITNQKLFQNFEWWSIPWGSLCFFGRWNNYRNRAREVNSVYP